MEALIRFLHLNARSPGTNIAYMKINRCSAAPGGKNFCEP